MDGTASSKADLIPVSEDALSASVEPKWLRSLLWLPDHARNMGIHIMAGKGSGKSRIIGRGIAWLDFVRKNSVVLFDAHGPSIDNFLDKLARLPRAYQERLWPRVLYVDMSGRDGYVVPFPLYYRLGNESLYTVSQRYLDVVHKIDPFLETASIEGWNTVWRMGTYTGMILAALGYQITEAAQLLQNPKAWIGRFTAALAAWPEVRPAVEFFTGPYLRWSGETRGRRTDAFANKIALFALDPSMKAMFGADRPGIDWARVVRDRKAVLLDFRHEDDLERKRFKMGWAFSCVLEFIRSRGAGRHRPISLIVDELSALLNFETPGVNLLAADLDELINMIARNYMVWLTLAHQELFQLDERTQKTLMAMGTQIFGATSDPQAALALAKAFYRYDPYAVKRYEAVYATSLGITSVIDHRPVEFTIEEQALLRSYGIADKDRFHFLVRRAPAEGSFAAPLRSMSIARLDSGLYVDEALVAQARAALSRRDGMPIADVLAKIELRLAPKAAGARRPRLPDGKPADAAAVAAPRRVQDDGMARA